MPQLSNKKNTFREATMVTLGSRTLRCGAKYVERQFFHLDVLVTRLNLAMVGATYV